MSINHISPIASMPPSQSLSVGDSPTREVSDKVASEFEKSLETGEPTMEDVNKALTLGVVNNIMNQEAEQRQKLAAVIEGRDPE
jgi:hypothetical protein